MKTNMFRAAAVVLSMAAVPILAPTPATAGVETLDAAKVPSGRYEIDPSHALVAARVNHLGFSATTVRFPKVSGALTYDPAHPEAASVDVAIETGSLSSDWEARDTDLKSPAFFNVAAFPTARFTATSLVPVDAAHAKVKGNLTMLGVTRPVELDVTLIGAGKGMMGDGRIGLEARGRINRSDFGMKTFLPAVSDAVDIAIDAEFTRK